jgi:hypothetical protein
MSAGLVIEEWGPDAALDVKKVTIKRLKNRQCYYTGLVRGHNGSHLALSAYDGLSEYIKTNQGQYFIEPVKGKEPDADGKQVHVIYKAPTARARASGTGGLIEAWLERLRWTHQGKRDAQADLKTDATPTTTSKHWYLELMVDADKPFLDDHNNINMETYSDDNEYGS